MHSQRELIGRSSGSIPLFCLLVCIVNATARIERFPGQESPPENAVHQRIAVLMSETLRERDKLTADGRRLWVPVPAPSDALQEVKGYGDKAVLILAEYLKSGSYHERELAMEFLSIVGGSRVLEALRMVIRSDPDPRLRIHALRYLEKASWKAAAPILREASTADADAHVRKEAKYILDGNEARESESSPTNVVRQRIATLMAHTVEKGGGVFPDGVKVWTVGRPSNEDIEEIKRYGDGAIPILSEYLTSEDGRLRDLAIRFLGILGGSRVVEPLERVIRSDPAPALREAALIWLGETPWELASPIIREAAQNDPDPRVRRTAEDLLVSGKPK
jgi:hypothetical protein